MNIPTSLLPARATAFATTPKLVVDFYDDSTESNDYDVDCVTPE